MGAGLPAIIKLNLELNLNPNSKTRYLNSKYLTKPKLTPNSWSPIVPIDCFTQAASAVRV